MKGKLRDTPEMQEPKGSPFTDLDKLKTIVEAVESMAEDERMRAFQYLKSRYLKYIPSDNY